MEEQLQNLNLDGMLTADDMKKLTELLGSNSVLLDKGNGTSKGKKKKGKMTPQTKNQLLSQLSAHQTIQENQKPLVEMDEHEKKAYRDELKKRLHNKQDMYKQMRSNQNLLQKSMDAKIKKSTETMKKEDIAKALLNALPVENMMTGKTEPVENMMTGKTEPVENMMTGKTEPVEKTENLEDFIN
jgi:hypothetical protein